MNSILFRLTSQLTSRDKVSASFDRIFKRQPHQFGPNTDRETASKTTEPNINYYTATAKWTSSVSNRGLLEVGWSGVGQAWRSANQVGIDQPACQAAGRSSGDGRRRRREPAAGPGCSTPAAWSSSRETTPTRSATATSSRSRRSGWQHEFKLSGAYPLPWYRIQLAGTLQAYPGNAMGEYWYFSRNRFLPSQYSRYDARWYSDVNCVAPCTSGGTYVQSADRTRQYGSGSQGINHALLPYETVKSLPFFAQLDLSLAKIINVGSWRYDTRFEAFNLFNAGTVLVASGAGGTAYGDQGTFEEAVRVMTGRVLRVSVTERF